MLRYMTDHLRFIQGVFTLLFFLSLASGSPFSWSLLFNTYDEGYILFSPGFLSYNLESIALLFNICGSEEVPTEQLIDLWECLGKQLSMKWGSYYRLENQFYSVVQIPTENKSMKKEIKYILILASSLFGHSILKSRKCPITFHSVRQMVWRC